jgi:hypothetical protein
MRQVRAVLGCDALGARWPRLSDGRARPRCNALQARAPPLRLLSIPTQHPRSEATRPPPKPLPLSYAHVSSIPVSIAVLPGCQGPAHTEHLDTCLGAEVQFIRSPPSSGRMHHPRVVVQTQASATAAASSCSTLNHQPFALNPQPSTPDPNP